MANFGTEVVKLWAAQGLAADEEVGQPFGQPCSLHLSLRKNTFHSESGLAASKRRSSDVLAKPAAVAIQSWRPDIGPAWAQEQSQMHRRHPT